VARRVGRLETLAVQLPGFIPWAADLTRAADRQHLADHYIEQYGSPDYLFLNAGLAHYGRLDRITSAQVLEQIDLNLVAVVDLAQRFLPAMLAARRGRILVVSSVLGVGPLPYTAVYAATKSAVNGFVRGLRLDLRGTGVTASAFCPAGVATEFSAVATADPDSRRSGQEPVQQVVEGMVRQLDRDRALLFPTRNAALGGLLMRLAPDLMEWLLATRVRPRFEVQLPPSRVGKS
jgi:short-subunit dehydrogenase